MHSDGLFREFLCFVLALSCLLATEVEGAVQPNWMQQLPRDMQREILTRLPLKDYVSTLQAFGRAMDGSQLPFEAELEMLKQSCGSESAARLLRLHLDKILDGGMEQVVAMQLLGELVNGIFSVLEGKRDRQSMKECSRVLVTDTRLDAELWKACLNWDIPGRTVRKRPETILVEGAKTGSIGAIRAIVSIFEKARIRVDLAGRRNSMMKQASENGHVAVVKFLFAKREKRPILYGRIDPAAGTNYAIRKASQNGHLAVVDYLLGRREGNFGSRHKYMGIDPAAKESEALRRAAASGHFHIIKYLLAKKEDDADHTRGYYRINPSARGNEALRMAAAYGHAQIVEYLLGKKEGDINNKYWYCRIDPAAGDNYAIMHALKYGHVEVVRLLLAKREENPELYQQIRIFAISGGMDPDARYGRIGPWHVGERVFGRPVNTGFVDDYDCAIQWASARGHVGMVRLFLEKREENPVLYGRINPAAGRNHAIQLASANGHVEVVRLLLKKKEENPALYERIDPASKDNSAIRLAARNGHVSVVALLLAHKEERPRLYWKLDPAAKDNYAIGCAAGRGHVDVVKLLLASKGKRPDLYWSIDPTAKNNYAIRWASRNGHGKVVEYLRKKRRDNPELYGGIRL